MRGSAEGERPLLLHVRVARRRPGFDFAIGVGRLFSEDRCCAELCDRRFAPANFALRAGFRGPGRTRPDSTSGCSLAISLGRTSGPRRVPNLRHARLSGQLMRWGRGSDPPKRRIRRLSGRGSSAGWRRHGQVAGPEAGAYGRDTPRVLVESMHGRQYSHSAGARRAGTTIGQLNRGVVQNGSRRRNAPPEPMSRPLAAS